MYCFTFPIFEPLPIVLGYPCREWFYLDVAGVNFVKLSISLGEIMFFNGLNGKCQIKLFD